MRLDKQVQGMPIRLKSHLQLLSAQICLFGNQLGVWSLILAGERQKWRSFHLGGIVTSQSIRIAGDEMDDAIVNYIRKTYNLMIGERTSEAIKMEIGSAGDSEGIDNMEIRGRDLLTGLPKTIEITAKEIAISISDTVYAIVDAVKIRWKKLHQNLLPILWTEELF